MGSRAFARQFYQSVIHSAGHGLAVYSQAYHAACTWTQREFGPLELGGDGYPCFFSEEDGALRRDDGPPCRGEKSQVQEWEEEDDPDRSWNNQKGENEVKAFVALGFSMEYGDAPLAVTLTICTE